MDIDKIIADAVKTKDVADKARKAFRDRQEILRNVRGTHNLVGNLLTNEQINEIDKIAPERKTRKSAGDD